MMFFFEGFFLDFELDFFNFVSNLDIFDDLRFSLMESVTKFAVFVL